MFTSKNLRRGLAVTALTAIGATALATSSASALVTEEDDVKLTSTGYDLGGTSAFTNGVPDEPATVTWDHAWFGVIPTVTGRIHFEGVGGECARVKLVSYKDNVEIGEHFSNDNVCAGSDDHTSRVLTDGGVDNEVTGTPGADEVEVILQSQNENGGWSRITGKFRSYGLEIDNDDVRISSDPDEEVHFGDGELVNSQPTEFGKLTWTSDGSSIDPVVTGKLFVQNADSQTVRMQAVYREEDGTLIETRNGGAQDITDDDIHAFTVNLDDFNDDDVFIDGNTVAKVRINIQKKPTGSPTFVTAATKLLVLN
jgi:hypothetical protein